ncbi:DNA translocase FtsK, partial [Pseudorhodoferax sp.]|uniref:DNA translocase FtsK n=1 Tax=Pseudorhodoferax sp. TaxID=1993553 RepID=UPI002DD699E6
MTYSLNTLNSSQGAEPPRSGIVRFAREFGLLLGLLVLSFWFISLISYSLQDAAWSTSGGPGATRNWGGRLGAWVADLSYFGLGYSVWWCVAAGARAWLTHLARWMRAAQGGRRLPPAPGGLLAFGAGLALLLLASCTLEWTRLYRLEPGLPGDAGGVVGYLAGPLAFKWLGFAGSGLVAIVAGIIGVAAVFRFSWSQVAERVGARVYALVERRREKREAAEDRALGKQAVRERAEGTLDPLEPEERFEPGEAPPKPARAPKAAKPPVVIEPQMPAEPQPSTRVVKERQKPLFVELPDSRLPQVDLLDAAQVRQETVSNDTLEMTSRMIEKKLKDFGVEVRVVLASPGPVITRYEIEPATGVKGSQIVNLAKDLARSLSLVSIRVIETIPGKNYMALELPNAKRQSIKLSEILGSQVYHEAKSMLTMGLGKDIIGNPIVADLAKMPHVLVAGTTGSGKSVGINAMILSLLYKAEARDVRLLMIDPKMLEMSVYEGIPHLLAPVVTDMRQAAHGLTWCVAEMERRYKLLSKMGVRNLSGYNAKIDDAKARGEHIGNPFSLTPEQPEPLDRLPHIVVVIDELADLMMVVGKKIEELIARLAQKARAAGIHLILATQRPS